VATTTGPVLRGDESDLFRLHHADPPPPGLGLLGFGFFALMTFRTKSHGAADRQADRLGPSYFRLVSLTVVFGCFVA
jgi:hypothetical protein